MTSLTSKICVCVCVCVCDDLLVLYSEVMTYGGIEICILLLLFTSDKGGGNVFCPCSFACLSVCLSVC